MSLAPRWRLCLGAPCALLLAALLAACGSTAAPRSTGPPVERPVLVVGVAANAYDDDPDRTAEAVRSVGVRWMRQEVRWPEIQPRRGRETFARYDAVMAAAARHGVRVLPLLNRTPRWTGVRHTNELPPDLEAWSAFVRVVVRRYGPGGGFWRAHPALDGSLAPRVWEVWNEAYLPQFAAPQPDPARYAAVLRAAVRAGRSASPGTRYLASAETTYVGSDGRSHDWLADMAAADPRLGEVVDGLAVHPYGPAPPATATGPFAFSRLGDLPAELERLGVGRRPLWITEMGYSTCGARPPCLTREAQARATRQALQLVLGRFRQDVAAYFAYELDDLPSSGPGDIQADYGLLGRDRRPKPVASVLAAAARASSRAP